MFIKINTCQIEAIDGVYPSRPQIDKPHEHGNWIAIWINSNILRSERNSSRKSQERLVSPSDELSSSAKIELHSILCTGNMSNILHNTPHDYPPASSRVERMHLPVEPFTPANLQRLSKKGPAKNDPTHRPNGVIKKNTLPRMPHTASSEWVSIIFHYFGIGFI